MLTAEIDTEVLAGAMVVLGVEVMVELMSLMEVELEMMESRLVDVDRNGGSWS